VSKQKFILNEEFLLHSAFRYARDQLNLLLTVGNRMNIKTLSYGVALLASLSLAPLNNSFASLPSDLDTSCTAASAVGCLSKIQSAVPTIADAAELDKVIGYLESLKASGADVSELVGPLGAVADKVGAPTSALQRLAALTLENPGAIGGRNGQNGQNGNGSNGNGGNGSRGGFGSRGDSRGNSASAN
jgi:uncharacterized membrane protein YgcG